MRDFIFGASSSQERAAVPPTGRAARKGGDFDKITGRMIHMTECVVHAVNDLFCIKRSVCEPIRGGG